jgi:hypothetical protein
VPILSAGERSPAQMRRLFALLKASGLDREDLATLMDAEGWGDDPRRLTPEAYELLTSGIIPSFGTAA